MIFHTTFSLPPGALAFSFVAVYVVFFFGGREDVGRCCNETDSGQERKKNSLKLFYCLNDGVTLLHVRVCVCVYTSG